MRPYKFIISGGGTGGHIFPAIAIANEIKVRYPDAEILFVGAIGRMEMEKIPAAGYKIIGLNISGIQKLLSSISFVGRISSIEQNYQGVQTGCGYWSWWLRKCCCIIYGNDERNSHTCSRAKFLSRYYKQSTFETCKQTLCCLSQHGTFLSSKQNSLYRKPCAS